MTQADSNLPTASGPASHPSQVPFGLVCSGPHPSSPPRLLRISWQPPPAPPSLQRAAQSQAQADPSCNNPGLERSRRRNQHPSSLPAPLQLAASATRAHCCSTLGSPQHPGRGAPRRREATKPSASLQRGGLCPPAPQGRGPGWAPLAPSPAGRHRVMLQLPSTPSPC